METPSNHTLVSMGDTNLTVLEPALDVRGRKVLDANGQEVGHVDDLLVDPADKHVRFLRVVSGGFLGMGGTKFLVPVDAVTAVHHDTVRIDRTREHVAGGPCYDPDLTDRANLEQVYGYYGVMPFWGVGYVYPGYPFYL